MHAHLLDRIGDPGRRGRALRLLLVLVPLVALGAVSSHLMAPARAAADPCSPLVNAIVCENSKAGTDQSIWDVSGAGDASIQGFATDISVNHGETVHFKIDTTGDVVPHRHLPDRLLRRRSARARSRNGRAHGARCRSRSRPA